MRSAPFSLSGWRWHLRGDRTPERREHAPSTLKRLARKGDQTSASEEKTRASARAAMTIKRGKGLALAAGKSGIVYRSRLRWRSVRPAPQRRSLAHRRRPKIHPTASEP